MNVAIAGPAKADVVHPKVADRKRAVVVQEVPAQKVGVLKDVAVDPRGADQKPVMAKVGAVLVAPVVRIQ